MTDMRLKDIVSVHTDLTTEEGANALIQETLKSYGRVDILVNLAGDLTKYDPSEEQGCVC